MTDTAREQYSRTRLLLGQAGLDKLRQARVAVFGVGGVGGYVVEALARSGVGALDLIDDDKVCLSNLNRQLALVMQAKEAGVPIICSMGAGNKLDPSRFEVADIYDTSVCPLARVMRSECRKRGIQHLKVVYSKEPPLSPRMEEMVAETAPQSEARPGNPKKRAPGSLAFVPSAAGLILAGEVICDLTGCRNG